MAGSECDFIDCYVGGLSGNLRRVAISWLLVQFAVSRDFAGPSRVVFGDFVRSFSCCHKCLGAGAILAEYFLGYCLGRIPRGNILEFTGYCAKTTDVQISVLV